MACRPVRQGDVDRLVVRDDLGVAARLFHEVSEIDRLKVESCGACALPGDEQEIVDEDREVLGLLDDALDGALVLGDALVLAAQGNLAFTTNDGQRRA